MSRLLWYGGMILGLALEKTLWCMSCLAAKLGDVGDAKND